MSSSRNDLSESGDEILKFDLAKSKAIVQYARNGENSLSISYLFILGHTYVSEKDYMLLRKYWNELCSIYKGTLVLRKK